MFRDRPCLVVLVAGLGPSVSVEGQAFQCANTTPAPPVVRAEGHAERLGDIVVDCTGGIPTPPGLPIPQVNIAVNLSVNMTSEFTADASFGPYFNEALLLVDEPSSPTQPTVPILNCGNTGAPDTTAAGPGTCAILGGGSLGAAATYNGTPGHPNVFQGRWQPVSLGSNQVLFASIPIDPPGTVCPSQATQPTCHRIIRITNLRGDAEAIGVGLA